MKKSISVVLSLLLLLLVAIPAFAGVTMVEVTKGASIRSQPNFNGNKIKLANAGSQFVYLGTEGSWYEVQVDADTKGYLPKDSCKLITAPGIPTGSAKDAFSNMILSLNNPSGFRTDYPDSFSGKTALAVYYDLGGKASEYSTEMLASDGYYWSIPEELLAADMKEADWALLIWPTLPTGEDEPIRVNVFAVDMKNTEYYAPYEMDDRVTVLENGDSSYELDSTLRGMEESIFYTKWEHMSRLANDEDYQAGLQYLKEEKYYSAYESFQMCSYLDEAAEMAESCIRSWPKTGEIWHNSSVKGNNVQLTVSVNQDSDRAMLVKIYKGDTHVSSLFIGGTGRATAKLPAGTYTIKDGVGTQWFGTKEAFGRYGNYETMTFGESESEQVQLKSGHSYTITVNVTDPDPTADSVGAEYQDWEGF